MTLEWAMSIGREAIMTALILAAPMLLAGLLVGLAISILQAVTQVNEMTLTFIPKILAVALAMMFSLPWMINRLVAFTTQLINSLPGLT